MILQAVRHILHLFPASALVLFLPRRSIRVAFPGPPATVATPLMASWRVVWQFRRRNLGQLLRANERVQGGPARRLEAAWGGLGLSLCPQVRLMPGLSVLSRQRPPVSAVLRCFLGRSVLSTPPFQSPYRTHTTRPSGFYFGPPKPRNP